MAEFWSVVTLVGLWGWVLSGTAFILRSFPRAGVFKGGRALAPALSLLLFFALWMLGMSRA